MDQQSPQTAKTPSSSIRPLPKQHHRNRRKHNLQIKQQRLILDVVKIQKNHFLESDMTSAGNLPESRHSRLEFFAIFDGLPEFPLLFHFVKVFDRERPGSDEAHVAFQDIEKLGKLVYAVSTNEPTDLRPSRIILHLEQRAVGLVVIEEAFLKLIGVLDHATELVEIENLSPFYRASLLLEENGATGLHEYCQGCTYEYG